MNKIKKQYLIFFVLMVFLSTCFSCGGLGVAGSRDDIRIGMTDDAVVKAWGPPMKRYRSVGSWGVREQWRYGFYGIATGADNFTYLYFQNGILKGWQN